MIFWTVFGASLLFGFVLLRGAPYVPTLRKQTEEAIKLLDIPKGSTVLELGAGDGRVALRLAKAGYRVVGYELNPILWLIAQIVTLPERRNVRVYLHDYWRVNWPEAEAAYVFLLERFMPRLDQAMTSYAKRQGRKVRLVSYAFSIPGKKPLKKHGGLFVYDYRP